MNSTLFKKNKRWLILFAAPAIILFCVIIVIPLFQTLYYSFFEWNGIKVAAFKGIENYKKLLHSREINTSFINSIGASPSSATGIRHEPNWRTWKVPAVCDCAEPAARFSMQG